jgi:hypothetical protein
VHYNGAVVKLHSDRLLEPQNRISILPFYLKIEVQY